MSLSGQLNQPHPLARGRRYHLGDYAAGPALPYIQEWMGRLGFFQGPMFGQPPLSTKTILCVTDLVNGLMIDQVWPKLLVVNPYVPDSLTACTTPLLNMFNASFSPWVANGGWNGATDLSVNGLTGNGTNKYFNSGINLSSTFLTANSYSMIVYTQHITATGMSAGGYANPGQGIYMAAQYTDGTSQGSNGVTITNNITVAGPRLAGYYCDSRITSTDHKLYFANGSNAHSAIGSEANALVPNLPNSTMYVHALNNIGGAGPQLYTADTISFFAIGNGLTSADSQNAFNRIQAYRVALGGGFV